MRRNTYCSTTVVWALLVWLAGTAAVAETIEPGVDLFEAVAGEKTFLELPDLPADFFGPGSDPFLGGPIFLQNKPLDIATVGRTSKAQQRILSFEIPDSISGPAPGPVPVEIVALSLQSANPITVTFGDGSATSFNVVVNINPREDAATSAVGELNFLPQLDDSFLVDSFFDITYRVGFEPVGGGGGPSLYKTEYWGQRSNLYPFTKNRVVGGPDILTIDPLAEFDGLGTSNFFPGLDPNNPTVPPVSIHYQGATLSAEFVLTAPEPSTGALAFLGAAALTATLIRRARRQRSGSPTKGSGSPARG